MYPKSAVLCLGVVLLVAISDARPAGDSKDGDGGDGGHHTHHHHHHTHHYSVGGGGGNGGGGDGGDGNGEHVHTHHHKGSPHVHHYRTGGSSHHHRTGGGGGDSSSSSGDGGNGAPSGLNGNVNLPDINLSGNLGGDGKGPSGNLDLGSLTGNLNLGGKGKGPSGDLDLGSLTGDLNLGGKGKGPGGDLDVGSLTGNLDANLPSGGDLNIGGGDGGGDGGLATDGSGGLRVPPFLDSRGEYVSLDGGTPTKDLVQRLRDAGVDLSGISPAVLNKLASRKYGHLGVDSTAPRDCTDEYYFNDGVLKHFVRGTRDAGDALLSGLHDVIGAVVGDEGILRNLDDGLLRGLQQLLCGAENGFSDFADDFDSATHIAKHGLIDIFKLEGDGLLAFPEGILGIGDEALQAIGSAAYDAVNAIGRGFDTLEQHVAGP